MRAMKRYIVFLPVFVWAIFFAGAEVKVENASIHRSGDSIRVSFKILVPSGTVASDYVQRLIPVIENGVDSLALDEIEIIGKRKQKLRRREAVLSGKTYEVPFYQTVDGGELQYDCVLPYEKWMVSSSSPSTRTIGIAASYIPLRARSTSSSRVLTA